MSTADAKVVGIGTPLNMTAELSVKL